MQNMLYIVFWPARVELILLSANVVDVMSVVVKVVNSILSHGLNHRQFRLLLEEVNEHYIDLFFFCEVRWLSRGAMLSRVCDLKQEIANFLQQK